MNRYDTQAPLIASYVILRKDSKIAFVLRQNTTWMDNYYSLPAGKVEKNESFLSAAVREGLEEAGIKINSHDLKLVHAMHRYTGTDNSEWVDMFFESTTFEGEPFNAEPEVHGELAWLDPENLPENLVPNIRFALEQIKQGNVYSEFGWDL